MAIGRAVLELSKAKHRGLQLHVWIVKDGVQANVKAGIDKSWGVTVRRTAKSAVLECLEGAVHLANMYGRG